MRDVLVTGGAGYIGSHVVLELLEAGYRPVVLDNLCTGSRDLVPDGVPFVLADVADSEAVQNVLRDHGVKDVVHCAASLDVQESMANPLKYWKNNVTGSIGLMEACAAVGVERLVFSSTAAAYGDSETMPVTEDLPTAPISPYGTTKRAVEDLIADVCRATGMKAIILRYFNVAGADPRGRAGASPDAEASLIRAVCQAALGIRDGIRIFGNDYDSTDGTAVRDYIHVCDLANVHRVVLEGMQTEAAGTARVVNCGYGKGVTVKEVVDTALRISGVDFPVHDAPRRDGDIAIMVADTRVLRERFRWSPKHENLGGIIETTLQWERQLRDRRKSAQPDGLRVA